LADGFNLPRVDIAEELQREVTIGLGSPTDARDLLSQFIRSRKNPLDDCVIDFDGDKGSYHGTNRRVKKTLLAGCSKISQRRGARKIGEGRRGYSVRWSEPIERNEAYESFSAACYRRHRRNQSSAACDVPKIIPSRSPRN